MGIDPSWVVGEYASNLIRHKARQLSRQSGFQRHEEEDLEQELRLALLRQVANYDPARSSRNTFAARVIDTAAAMLVRDRQRQKRRPPTPVVSIDVPPRGSEGAAD